MRRGSGPGPRAAATALALFVWLFAALPAGAQRGGINVPGDFDFFVLALSWSPTYCAVEGTAADRRQCGEGRRHHFVVHGLWPQYEQGWPEFCPGPPDRPPETVVRRILDIMPSAALARHQWAKHGTCSGLSPEGYFDLTRRARDRVTVPRELATLDNRVSVSPEAVAGAFQDANPGLRPEAMAVTCDPQRLREVRLCLDRDTLGFRPCPEVAERACARDSMLVPPVGD